ncbi:MAG: hypothetical protein HY290_09960, partial [Planctomycetia bacterium]|nr:hypothetical protein [Planctomycetia bacterium]
MIHSSFVILIAIGTALIVFSVCIRWRSWRQATALSLIVLIAVAFLFRDSRRPRKTQIDPAANTAATPPLAQWAANMPAQEPADGYVSSRACAECHPGQHDTWHASYHRKMTQRATPAAVLGDFADKHVELDGAAYDLSRRGDEFWVKVTLLREDQRWISRDASFLKPRDQNPNAPGIGRWNTQCIQCHATHGRARTDAESRDISSDSLVAEFGIACEACHGPGERHVRFRRGEPVEDKIVNPAGLASQRSAQVCGRCHSITIPKRQSDYPELLEHGHRFRPGDDLAESLHVMRLDQATRDLLKANVLPNDQFVDRAYDMQFWGDGVVRVAGREFNGLVESACYQKGEMACVSCHVLHKPAGDPRPVAEWADDQLKIDALG